VFVLKRNSPTRLSGAPDFLIGVELEQCGRKRDAAQRFPELRRAQRRKGFLRREPRVGVRQRVLDQNQSVRIGAGIAVAADGDRRA
jgi:hypothetical protein